MAFSLEDVLEEFAEASRTSSKREWLDGGAYSFITRGVSLKEKWGAEKYRRWLDYQRRYQRKWWKEYYRRPGVKERVNQIRCARLKKNRQDPKKRPAILAQEKQKRLKVKADPMRLAKKRESDRLAAKKYRAKKRRSHGQAVNVGR